MLVTIAVGAMAMVGAAAEVLVGTVMARVLVGTVGVMVMVGAMVGAGAARVMVVGATVGAMVLVLLFSSATIPYGCFV